MRHIKVHRFFRVRVGTRVMRLRVSMRGNESFAAKYGDQWFWIRYGEDRQPFIDPHHPIPGGNYDDGRASAA